MLTAFPQVLSALFFETGSLIGLEFPKQAGMTGQQAPRICVSQLLKHANY